MPMASKAQDPATVIYATPLVRILDMPSNDAFMKTFLGTSMLVSTEPLGFGTVQINRAGQVSLSVLGAMPATDYRLYFCPFLEMLDSCKQVGEKPTRTDSSGNGVNVYPWTYSSMPVAGSFLVVWGSDPVMASFISGFQLPVTKVAGNVKATQKHVARVNVTRSETKGSE